MKKNKYKVQYKTLCAAQKEVKFDTYDGLTMFIADTIMVVDQLIVYQKIKGTWELIRVIDSKNCYAL